MKKVICLIFTILLITISYFCGLFLGFIMNTGKKKPTVQEIVSDIEVPDLDSIKDDNFVNIEYYM